ncbi:hypothetical protein [Actinomadura sp. HBU206391]|uniref:hypothetical protein n=1 Tax=Actinomadura sp. HBU206391 TaxID=2731692 RepID=UPI00164F1D2D|nr:hypothetical protein [Actinomadura sp. HBU206391]MBC6460432.1 hypothetical protein [Actinomadura sp. HBU206391]
MAEPIQISRFPEPSPEDSVSLEISAHDGGSRLELVLETAPGVTRWKAIQVRSLSGRLLAEVETQGADHGPQVAIVEASALPGARLVLAKAKAFGARTAMYELRGLDVHVGERLKFLWQRDDHRAGRVVRFSRDLGRRGSHVSDAMADAAEAAVHAVGEFASDVIETAGTALRNGLEMSGGRLAHLPIIGPKIRFLLHWLATVTSTAFDLVGTALKAVFDLVGGVGGGAIRLAGGGIGGLAARDGRTFVKGIGDGVSSLAGALLVILAKTVAFVQAVLFMQLGERALTEAERSLLQQVFRGSVALYNVRVVQGFAGLFSVNVRPFALGNTIYMKHVDLAADPDALVHECTHVWQFQRVGTRYTTDALWAQARVADTYSWEAELARDHLRWQDFNKEAQAAFLEKVWRWGALSRESMTGSGVFYKDDPIGDDVEFVSSMVNHTSLALESVAYVRGATAWRLSAFL